MKKKGMWGMGGDRGRKLTWECSLFESLFERRHVVNLSNVPGEGVPGGGCSD